MPLLAAQVCFPFGTGRGSSGVAEAPPNPPAAPPNPHGMLSEVSACWFTTGRQDLLSFRRSISLCMVPIAYAT